MHFSTLINLPTHYSLPLVIKKWHHRKNDHHIPMPDLEQAAQHNCQLKIEKRGGKKENRDKILNRKH